VHNKTLTKVNTAVLEAAIITYKIMIEHRDYSGEQQQQLERNYEGYLMLEMETPIETPRDLLDTPATHTVELLLPNGTNFGEGSISYKTQMEAMEAKGIDIALLHEAATSVLESGVCIVPIDHEITDDGCGDGRVTAVVFSRVPESQEVKEYKKSKERAKIFGGGAAVSREMLAAVKGPGASMDSDLQDSVKIVKLENEERLARGQKGIMVGAHTDTHAHGPNCGCGAIDKSEVIIGNSVKYADKQHPLISAVTAADAADTTLQTEMVATQTVCVGVLIPKATRVLIQ
jgi:hypothetical protein